MKNCTSHTFVIADTYGGYDWVLAPGEERDTSSPLEIHDVGELSEKQFGEMRAWFVSHGRQDDLAKLDRGRAKR